MQNAIKSGIYTLYATLLAVFSTFASGCDGDGPSSEPAGTTGATMTGTDSGDESGSDQGDQDTADDTGSPPASCAATAEFCCDPQGEMACQNDQDCPLVESGVAKDAAADCGIACLGQDDACSATCMAEAGVTADCGQCVVDYGSCLTMNCLAECVGGDATACTECGRDKPSPQDSCSSRFFACSGTTRNPDYAP